MLHTDITGYSASNFGNSKYGKRIGKLGHQSIKAPWGGKALFFQSLQLLNVARLHWNDRNTLPLFFHV